MDTSIETESRYVPSTVSRYFRLDWNYALRVVRIRWFQLAAQLVISTPLIAQFAPLRALNEPRVWALWVSSGFFLLGFVVLRLRAPIFIQEYRNYKEYADFGHSHRWILWQFQLSLAVFRRPELVLQETIDKELSLPAGMQLTEIGKYDVTPFFGAPSNLAFDARPVNLNNDLYFPFWLNMQRYVLPIQEFDPRMRDRERELFWIIFTYGATARPVARFVVWTLFLLAGISFTIAAVMIGYKIFTSSDVSCIDIGKFWKI
jgi:hypothetical protein